MILLYRLSFVEYKYMNVFGKKSRLGFCPSVFLVMVVFDRQCLQSTCECFCIPYICTCCMRHKDVFCESVSGIYCQKSVHKSTTWGLPGNDKNCLTTFF